MTSLAVPRVQPVQACPERAARRHGTSMRDALGVVSRLAAEFPGVDRQTVDRQVRDTWNCALHLSAEVTPGVVEKLAREHLIALDGSLDLIRTAPAGRRHRAEP